MNKPTEETGREGSIEYRNMVDLLAVHSEAHHRMAALEAELNQDLLSAMDERRRDYARLQETLSRTRSALEGIAVAHPEWFAARRSLKTPYGSLKFTRSTTLEAPNPEATILLVRMRAEKDGEFKADSYLRQSEALNLEALETLDDATLRSLRIARVTTQNFKVEAARVDMGKAVKEAAEVAG